MTPLQAGKPAEIAIGDDPLAAILDRDSGQIRVCNEIAFGAGRATESCEDIPVTRAGRNRHVIRLFAQLRHEPERIRQ